MSRYIHKSLWSKHLAMRVIMLGGRARVGKTTLATYISEYAYKRGFWPVLLPFAKPLKDDALAAGYSKEDNPIEYRQYCQSHGAEKRKEDINYWVKRWRDEVTNYARDELTRLEEESDYFQEHVLVVDDCRYPNEVMVGRDLHATQIFVMQGKRVLEDEFAEWRSHESEDMAERICAGSREHQDLFEYKVYNDTSIGNLRMTAHRCIDNWLENTDYTGEMLKARIEDRPPDYDKLLEELVDTLEWSDFEE